MYIHERDDWPRFRWDQDGLANQLAAVRHRQGRLIGRMEGSASGSARRPSSAP